MGETMAETRCYELCFILKSNVTSETKDEVHQKVLSIVKENSGTIDTIDEWITQDLAYPINKEKRGQYHFMQLKGSSDFLAPLKKYLTLQGNVLRHEFFRYKADYDYHELKKTLSAFNNAEPAS